VGESNKNERLARAISRLGGRAKIALRSDSEYDEFIVVQNSEDAVLLLEITDAVVPLQSQLDRETLRLASLTQQRDAARELVRMYVPNFAQNRYFNTDGQYAYERHIGEVRARFDEVCEGDHFTVVKPDADLGYTIHIGGIQPREHVIELLKERLAREYEHYLSALTPAQEAQT
jgi:hypothetical protein